MINVEWDVFLKHNFEGSIFYACFSTFPYMTFLTTSFWSCCCCRSIVKHGSRKVEAAFSLMAIVVVVKGFSNTRYKIKTLKGIWKVRIEDQMTSKKMLLWRVIIRLKTSGVGLLGFALHQTCLFRYYFIRGCKNSPNCNILYINFHTFSPTH